MRASAVTRGLVGLGEAHGHPISVDVVELSKQVGYFGAYRPLDPQ